MITIATIVEGHGEIAAVPLLLRRIAQQSGVFNVRIPPPFRLPRSKMVNPHELGPACVVSAKRVSDQGCILILLDADDDCAVDLAKTIRSIGPDLPVPLLPVVANRGGIL